MSDDNEKTVCPYCQSIIKRADVYQVGKGGDGTCPECDEQISFPID